MTVSPLPRHGIAMVGRDRPGRTLRVSSHPDAGRTVFSIWTGDRCEATVRLAPEDVAELIGVLATALADGTTQVTARDAG